MLVKKSKENDMTIDLVYQRERDNIQVQVGSKHNSVLKILFNSQFEKKKI